MGLGLLPFSLDHQEESELIPEVCILGVNPDFSLDLS
jgi:hypothetical protein